MGDRRRHQGWGDDRRGIAAVDGDQHADHRRGHQGEPARVHRQQHAHGVGRDAGIGVEALELLHGAKAEGRGGVVQAQQIGREVHGDGTEGRMVLRHLREQPTQRGPQGAPERMDEPGLGGQAHHAQPERHDRHQIAGQDHPIFGVEDSVGPDRVDTAGEASEQQREDDQSQPDVVQQRPAPIPRLRPRGRGIPWRSLAAGPVAGPAACACQVASSSSAVITRRTASSRR